MKIAILVLLLLCALVGTLRRLRSYPSRKKHFQKPHDAVSVLPPYLEELLDNMGARYELHPKDVKMGVKVGDRHNRMYLGTYFPRSFKESLSISGELLAVPPICEAFRDREVIRILDFGSGTGGAVMGILEALSRHHIHPKKVVLKSIDANEDALVKQKLIIDEASRHLNMSICTQFVKRRFPYRTKRFASAMSEFVTQEQSESYDIILASKCLIEFYHSSYKGARGVISTFLDHASQMLSLKGLCIIVDVTSMVSVLDNEYFSMTLNREVNDYERGQNSTLKSIVPIPCAYHSRVCKELPCFTQRIFPLYTRFAPTLDVSKVAYRVLAPIEFADSIIASYSNYCDYRVNAARPGTVCRNGKKETSNNSRDGFTDFV